MDRGYNEIQILSQQVKTFKAMSQEEFAEARVDLKPGECSKEEKTSPAEKTKDSAQSDETSLPPSDRLKPLHQSRSERLRPIELRVGNWNCHLVSSSQSAAGTLYTIGRKVH